jgi:allophanate hydrolase subunit 2
MGGYPVVGVVVTADLHRLAHVGSGTELTLRPVRDAPAAALPRVRVTRFGEL